MPSAPARCRWRPPRAPTATWIRPRSTRSAPTRRPRPTRRRRRGRSPMTKLARHLASPLALAMLALVAGCGGENEELQEWIEVQKREVKPSVQPLLPPKKFDPEPYAAGTAVEPFSQQKLTVALKQEARQPSSLLASELNRRKEPLEAYPLDSMTMVGSVAKQGQPYALLRVDNLLYQV